MIGRKVYHKDTGRVSTIVGVRQSHIWLKDDDYDNDKYFISKHNIDQYMITKPRPKASWRVYAWVFIAVAWSCIYIYKWTL